MDIVMDEKLYDSLIDGICELSTDQLIDLQDFISCLIFGRMNEEKEGN